MTDTEKISLELIAHWLRNRAEGWYGGEAVTQLQHALQCASLAQAAGANTELVVAALLHDVAHVADIIDDGCDDMIHPHGEQAAYLLKDLFSPAVTEPIRLHVDAKRYLCVVDESYWAHLSPASKRSLEWQGGPFSQEEARLFIGRPFASDAVRLRRWDDAAKDPNAAPHTLEHFVGVMASVARPVAPAGAEAI